jgi:hypothetical protein
MGGCGKTAKMRRYVERRAARSGRQRRVVRHAGTNDE